MAILLGYTTALEYWRSCATAANALLHEALLGHFRERRDTTTRLQRELQKASSRHEASAYLATFHDAHVITVKQQVKPRHNSKTLHTFLKLPPCSCVRANEHFRGESLFVSTPEFCFLQLASKLPFEQLIALGFELCGTYAASDDRTLYDTYPLTSPVKLMRFLSNARGFNGIVMARRAVRHVIANSASPMETNIAMMLCLPYSLGGYGIAHPRMNHRIDIPESLRKRGDGSYRICDLYWGDVDLAIEYDSDLAHAGISKTASDAVRRSTLEAVGVSVMSVTWPQVVDVATFDHLAHLVAHKTGKQLRYDAESFKWKHRKLRSLIFPR